MGMGMGGMGIDATTTESATSPNPKGSARVADAGHRLLAVRTEDVQDLHHGQHSAGPNQCGIR